MDIKKAIEQHYSYLLSITKENGLTDSLEVSDLLYSFCLYFRTLGKPAVYSDRLCSRLMLDDAMTDYTDLEKVIENSASGKALYSFAKISADNEAQSSANERFFAIIQASNTINGSQSPERAEAYCNAIFTIALLSGNDRKKAVAFAQDNLSLFLDESYLFNSAESAFNGVIGLLLLSPYDSGLLSVAINCGRRFAAQNINFDYSFNTSFKDENSLADPTVTSLALRFYTMLYKATGDSFFLYIARRIWFNGFAFFQRIGGFVGYNNPPRLPDGILSVATFEEPDRTPLYSVGLCTHEQNKELFNEYDAPVKKDPRGRYIVDDKVFAKELGEYFGKDLIEIPSLLSFDKDSALSFKFKLLF